MFLTKSCLNSLLDILHTLPIRYKTVAIYTSIISYSCFNKRTVNNRVMILTLGDFLIFERRLFQQFGKKNFFF